MFTIRRDSRSHIRSQLTPYTLLSKQALSKKRRRRTVVLGDSDLTSFLIHNGDLQDKLDNPLGDVEIEGYEALDITFDSVDIDEDQVIFEGKFEVELETLITESYSRNYSSEKKRPITITGSIILEFAVDFSQEDDFINYETCTIEVGGFEV
ncbi:hypothetical protein HQN90_36660 [Paenibacillus alba]|uniref:hypothetical protein n=1 Tax=Paenibacillus alba TaxID=1197127 RepID=UPI001564E60D|nr:hypothetical protein [Paenibacillus alba]NQX71624.1 hypothetical protein [Paenibacillus alba]